jgi:hypothetical protein
MRFKISSKALKKLFLYGPFPEPFSNRYGNGWFALLLGAAHRASPIGLLFIAVGLPSVQGSSFNFTPIFTFAAFLISCIFFERNLIRQAAGEEISTRPNTDRTKAFNQLLLSSARASIIFLIYMGIYSSLEKLTLLHVDQTLSLGIAVISLFLGAFLPKLYRSSDLTS